MNEMYIVRALPYGEDSRVLRYKRFFESNGVNVKVIQWGGEDKDNVISCPVPRLRGKPFLNLFLTPLFSLWVFFYIALVLRGKRVAVLAVDLDCGFPVYLVRLFRAFLFFYDIADPYSVCRFNKNLKIINKLESVVSKKADAAIVPGDSRCDFYDKGIDFHIIENVPTYPQKYKKEVTVSAVINIGYFGNLEPNVRCLEDLVEVVLARNNIVLHVAGTGGLHDFFHELSIKNPRKVKFYGRYTHTDIPNLAQPIDVLFAGYSAKKEHHQYIESNKSYEHLYLGVGILTNYGTNLTKKILSWDTGWFFEENTKSLHSVLDELADNKQELIKKSDNAKKIWIERYLGYWLENKDLKLILQYIER